MLDGLRILIVEDLDIVGEILAELLAEAGARVIGPAASVAEARALAAAHALDGAFLDINLGQELCWPVAAALRDRGVPVVLLTGSSEEADVPAEWLDATRLLKPVPQRELVATAARAFQRVLA